MDAKDDGTPDTTTPPTLSAKKKMERARSAVRQWVTYIAAAFVFGLGTPRGTRRG